MFNHLWYMVKVNRGEIGRQILNGHRKVNNVAVDMIDNITRRDPTAVELDISQTKTKKTVT